MTDQPRKPIEHVSDTARWVAVYRAMESERPDALFKDPFARRLAGDRGVAIVTSLKRGEAMAWPMIVRTAVLDEIILRAVEHDGVDLVVNLAAGLDARPWRLDLPKSLTWVDVDLPAMLEHKLEHLRGETPRANYEAVPLDLRDAVARRAVFARLGARSQRALVVTEGLLVYLSKENVGALATDLHAVPSVRWWTFDLANPRALKIMQRSWGAALSQGNATMRFAPAEGATFFTQFGWREREAHLIGDEARRLKREMRGAWFWRAVLRLYPARIREEFRRMSAIVVLERA